MFLNQTYLVLGIPIILLTIELVRHFKTLAFVELASEQRIVEKDPGLELKWIREERGHEGGEHGGREVARELGRMRRRGRNGTRERYEDEKRYSSSDEATGTDEDGRLISV